VPQRGEKKDLVDTPAERARGAGPAAGRNLDAGAAARRLRRDVRPGRAPARIEVYDNSHIMGTNAVGAMIVAGPEGFVKNQYRKFNIRSTDITPGDDFGMMREVMERRFSRLIKETADERRRGTRAGMRRFSRLA
jgi:excinuclease ABC subunit C